MIHYNTIERPGTEKLNREKYMRFKYCPQCGEKLISKEIGDEGQIPFCEVCRRPFWDMFTTSIICAVINEYNEIALIRQSYVSKTKYVCIAGMGSAC